MKKRTKRKSRVLITILSVILIAGIAMGGLSIMAKRNMDKLPSMSFEDMLAYTTADNKDAIITVGIIQDGEIAYTVYGDNSSILPSDEHMYEIGSITKTFTTSLLCKAISEDKINMDDSIDSHINLPEKDYYPTIKELVTHTSGYKPYYFERPMISNALQARNSFYDITNDMLINRLGRINLVNEDYPFEYSNFGMAVAGAILGNIYGRDYTTLMNEYISEDLGLSNTRISDGTGDLYGYWEWSAFDAYIPAGAIIADITDMLCYAQMQMQDSPGYLSLAHKPLAEGNATSSSYEKLGIRIDAVGAGWMLDTENNIIWHNGGTGNFNSYLAFDKENQIAVVILSNLPPNYRIPATVMGIRLMKDFQEQN